MQAVALCRHRGHLSLATCHHIDDSARILLGQIDGEQLYGLAFLAIYLLDDNLRLPYLQFISFAPHGLDKDREVQHTPAIDIPDILFGTLFDTQGQVFVQLASQTVGYMAGGHILAVAPKERRIVYGKCHRHGRLVDGYAFERLGIEGIGNGIANLKIIETYQRTDVTATGTRHFGASHAFKEVKLLDTLFHYRAVTLAESYLHSLAQLSAVNATYGDTPYIRRVIERCDKHLGRAFQIGRLGDILYDGIEQGLDVIGRLAPVGTHPSLFGRTVYSGEIELLFRCVETKHKVEHHVLHLIGATVGLVNFVNDNHRLQTHFYRFLQHKTGLRHGALESVDEQQTAVGHIEHPLYLTAEIGVSRRIYNIYLIIFIPDRDVLRKNRDASLTLQVIIIEYQLAGFLVLAKKMTGHQHFIDQCRFSMIDMGYNGNIPYFLHNNLLNLYRTYASRRTNRTILAVQRYKKRQHILLRQENRCVCNKEIAPHHFMPESPIRTIAHPLSGDIQPAMPQYTPSFPQQDPTPPKNGQKLFILNNFAVTKTISTFVRSNDLYNNKKLKRKCI